jgi:hypothetical protein
MMPGLCHSLWYGIRGDGDGHGQPPTGHKSVMPVSPILEPGSRISGSKLSQATTEGPVHLGISNCRDVI